MISISHKSRQTVVPSGSMYHENKIEPSQRNKLFRFMRKQTKRSSLKAKKRRIEVVQNNLSEATAELSEEFSVPSRRVTLDYNVRVRPIMSRKDYTPEEVQNTWYTQEEYDIILYVRQKQINKLNQGKEFKDIKYSGRGLEGQTNDGLFKMEKATRIARRIVKLTKTSLFDDEMIATTYRKVASQFKLKAQTIALRDQEEAVLLARAQ